MPTTLLKKTVQFDNRVQAGETTANELLAAFQAAGFNTNIANPIKEPVTKKLIQCEFFVRGATAQQIDDTTFANPGVVGYISPVPPPLTLIDLTTITLATLTLLPVQSPGRFGQSINVAATIPTSQYPTGGIDLGNITAPNPYADQQVNFDPSTYSATVVRIINGRTDTALTIASSEIALVHDGVTTPLLLTSPIVLPAAGTATFDQEQWYFYVDINGKMYASFKFTVTNGVQSAVGPFDYATSVGNGAV